MYVYKQPKVTLIAWPQFAEPSHLKVKWLGESTNAEKLVEFSGRLCYMSQGNPANKSTEQYLENILEQRHGSVAEHATFSVLIEQVSRSLTHELVRHRAGFAYSQLSQRYVDESDVGVVMPPALQEAPKGLQSAWVNSMIEALDEYRALVDALLEQYVSEPDTTLRKKKAREAARSVLPNATETKLVATANARAWRHFLELRGSAGAEAEIRQLSRHILAALRPSAPHLFADVQLDQNNLITVTHSKV